MVLLNKMFLKIDVAIPLHFFVNCWLKSMGNAPGVSKSMENALGASWVHIFTFPHDFLIRSLWGMPLEFHGPMLSHLCLKSIRQWGMLISWTNSFKFPHHIFIRNEMENFPGAPWANYFAFLYQICINN